VIEASANHPSRHAAIARAWSLTVKSNIGWQSPRAFQVRYGAFRDVLREISPAD
jgi:hypothetical protein